MDETDRRLIEALRENARAPTAQLARRLGLSRTTVQSRIERLERSGVIAGYTRAASPTPTSGGEIHAYVLMTVTPRHAPSVIAAVRRLPAVRLLQSVSGPFDLLARVAAPDVAEMDERDRRPGRPGRRRAHDQLAGAVDQAGSVRVDPRPDERFGR